MNRSYVFPLLALSLLVGCDDARSDEEAGTGAEAIVDVPQTPVETQAISNCWLYAHAAWAESLYLQATGRKLDISESYWSYWHWLGQILDGRDQIDPEGSWETANRLIARYGLMQEANFIRADANGGKSRAQSEALAALQASLASGALKTAAARRDRRLVRAELDRAWKLTSETRAMLDQIFGPGAERSFESGATETGPVIHRADEIAAAYARAPGAAPTNATLARAISEWKKVRYEGSDRAFQIRVQRALHDAQPVYLTWFVDGHALESGDGPLHGGFNMETLRDQGPGRQGIHMSIIEDYQAVLSDGTRLPVGRTLKPQDPSAQRLLTRALESGTRIELFRIKNSWGTGGATAFVRGMPGYNDLYMNYLEGPVSGRRPLMSVMLPPGY